MKHLSLFILFSITFSVVAQKDTSFFLTNNWSFSLGNNNKIYQATVPGSIYYDLLNNELIDDPFIGNNEQNIQWIADSVWIYRCKFDLEDKILLNKNIELQCEGLDTYSKVWVNDSLVFVTDNAFRNWMKDVKRYLKPGSNNLLIQFEPVAKKAKLDSEKIPYTLPEGARPFVRKPQFQFGWDFAPRFLGCAIWKPVRLICWNGFKIRDVQMIQNNMSDKVASFTANIEIHSDVTNEINITILDKRSGKQLMLSTKRLKMGKNNCKVDFVVEEPRLWWCNGLGKPELYEFEIKIADRYLNTETITEKVGIRKVEWIQENDSLGKSFYLKLNGIPVFAKGSNIVPLNYFPAKADTNVYKRIINTAVESNMNMLRVWGGGIYENDLFYDLCDEKGIMVWQDFMFACAMYPGDSSFISSVKNELKDNISRLRNHPSLVLWCGNNESSEGWYNWGWQKQFAYKEKDSIRIWNDYINLFEKVIPEMINRYDSTRFYWPSSPSIGWGRKESLLSGDCHYWGVWWGKEPFDVYGEKIGRFMSEYGFQGLPSYKSMQVMSGSLNPQMSDKEIKNHQKHPTGFETISDYINTEYSPPTDFSDFIYKSQLVQADGISKAIQSHRKAKPYCMGSLYWQMNDCWPGISWSGMDYFGRWKAVQYSVQKEFKNIVLTIDEVQDTLLICIVSDEAKTIQKRLRMKLMTFEGKVLWENEIPVDIKPFAVSDVYKISVNEIVQKNDKRSLVFAFGFIDDKKTEVRTHYFFKNKELKLKPVEVKTSIVETKEGSLIMLKSDYLLKDVCVSVKGEHMIFDNNYFDMLPGETYTLKSNKKMNKGDLPQLKFNYLVNP